MELEREIEKLKSSIKSSEREVERELEILTIYKSGSDGKLHIDEVWTRELKKEF